MATEKVYYWIAERNKHLFHVYSDLHYHNILEVRSLVTRMLYNEMHNYSFHQKFILSTNVIQLPSQSLRQSWGRK